MNSLRVLTCEGTGPVYPAAIPSAAGAPGGGGPPGAGGAPGGPGGGGGGPIIHVSVIILRYVRRS